MGIVEAVARLEAGHGEVAVIVAVHAVTAGAKQQLAIDLPLPLTGAELAMPINREMLRGANEMTEDALQVALLNSAGTIRGSYRIRIFP